MSSRFPEVHDYEAVRRAREPTAFLVEVSRRTLVLGSAQGDDVLRPDASEQFSIHRRRGGGGVVLVRPGDLWVDLWIPADDPRFDRDLGAAAQRVGEWWRTCLGGLGASSLSVHTGALLGRREYLVACFAGVGAGEVLHDGRKIVGLTQWRVREGSLVSTVLHRSSSGEIVNALRASPAGLADALEHGTISSVGLAGRDDEVVGRLLDLSGPWTIQSVLLN